MISSSEAAGNQSRIRLLVGVVLVLWFAAVFVLGAKGLFVRKPDVPPVPILLGATVPPGISRPVQACRAIPSTTDMMDLMVSFPGGRFGRAALPGKDEEQGHSDADGAVGDVESREAGDLPIATFHVEIEEIDHMLPARQHSVDQVPQNPAKDETE